jgi:hypothetical protein
MRALSFPKEEGCVNRQLKVLLEQNRKDKRIGNVKPSLLKK